MNMSLNLYTVYIHSVSKKIKGIINYFLKTDLPNPKKMARTFLIQLTINRPFNFLFQISYKRESSYCFSMSYPSQFCPSVLPSVRYTGRSVKNGAS